jgi:D-alanine transaminase
MSDTVFLNGRYIPREEALIPADDRGFHFADGVYEVVKYYYGKPFRLEDHMNRLQSSLAKVKIAYGGVEEIPMVFNRLIKLNDLEGEEAALYLQISRGAHQRVHHFPAGLTPTVYAFAFKIPSFTEFLRNGIKAVTAEDIRWQRCDIKSVSLLPNTMLYQEATEKGAAECILIRNGYVTEATHSSVVGIRSGAVYTHPLSTFILPGITRKVILEICTRHGIPCKEEAITAEDLPNLDELLVCGTGALLPTVNVTGSF